MDKHDSSFTTNREFGEWARAIGYGGGAHPGGGSAEDESTADAWMRATEGTPPIPHELRASADKVSLEIPQPLSASGGGDHVRFESPAAPGGESVAKTGEGERAISSIRPHLDTGRRAHTLKILRAIVDDPRFVEASSGSQTTLLVAIIMWSDATGCWFTSKEKWGKAVGLGPRQVQRAISRLEATGLFTVTAYLRPPGTAAPGRQGSNNYALDPMLTRAGETAASPLAKGDKWDTPRREDTEVTAPSEGECVLPERPLNGKRKNGTALVFIDQCMGCGLTGPLTDDGRETLCPGCRAKKRQEEGIS